MAKASPDIMLSPNQGMRSSGAALSVFLFLTADHGIYAMPYLNKACQTSLSQRNGLDLLLCPVLGFAHSQPLALVRRLTESVIISSV